MTDAEGDVAMADGAARSSGHKLKPADGQHSNGHSASPPSSSPSASPPKHPEAEKHKEAGNALFAAKHFSKAMDCYSAAIGLDATNPVYFSNRAFCHIRLEEYGSAIEDATKAIECDKNFIKVSSATDCRPVLSCITGGL